MKLYMTPGACSRAVHIALREAELPFALEPVDLATHQTASGEDFTHVNPKGYVPLLDLEDGNKLTEVAAILQFVADQNPKLHLAPASGTWDRYRLEELLNYVSTEIHKSFRPFFEPEATDAERDRARARLEKRFEHLDRAVIGDQPFLTGDRFTVADAYLFVMLGWAEDNGIDIGRWPSLARFREAVGARPAVRAAIEAEDALG